MPVAHLQIKYKASAARMSEATSGFRCASDPACRCAHAGYAFAGESTATVRAPAASMSLPIPVTAIEIGEPVGDEGYLGISVGQAELVFSVPMSAFDPLGRTILTLSAQSDPQ